MAIESDVLVIGGGLAGLTSALAAAQADIDVRLVTYKQSTLQQASGLVDVLGYRPNGDGPISNPFEAIPSLPVEHPYQTVGVDAVRTALSLFDEVTDYAGSHTDANALIPTHGGTIKPTARYPQSACAGIASDNRPMLLVGFDSITDFDAPLAADHLTSTGVPFDVRGVTIQFPGDLSADAKVTRYAKLLDTNGDVTVSETGGGGHRPARDALADRVKIYLDDETRVGFPAVLGDANAATVRATLGTSLGADVFEVPMGPPSLPGLRLEDQLFDALSDAGGFIESGNPVIDYTDDGSDTVEKVIVERNGAEIPMRAEQYILATGGLVGKGVESNREGVYEPIFGCHVAHDADRYEWFDEAVFGEHSFARFGVDTDTTLRPVDESGNIEFENLRAAGAVLGGYDYAAEKSASGVSIATGYTAGMNAATTVAQTNNVS